MRRAGELRAPFVVVRLGDVEPVAAQWIDARDRFLRGALDDDALQSLLPSRDRAAERALDVATRALERLAREAERAGAVLLVRNGRRYVDLPSPRELDRLRAELSGAPLLPAADVPAAHLADVMGFAPMALTLAATPMRRCGTGATPAGPSARWRRGAASSTSRPRARRSPRRRPPRLQPWVRPVRRRESSSRWAASSVRQFPQYR